MSLDGFRFNPIQYLIQSLNSLDSSRPYGGLLLNQKAGGSKEQFLPKNDFQNSSTNIFPKKHPDFGGLEINRRHEIQNFFAHALLHIEYNIKIILGTLKKTSAEKAKKLNFSIF